jgi:hypothetical protein
MQNKESSERGHFCFVQVMAPLLSWTIKLNATFHAELSGLQILGFVSSHGIILVAQ